MIRFIEDKDEKRKISREILESLTEWFEVEESREQYIRESADQPFWAAFEDDVPAGFLCLGSENLTRQFQLFPGWKALVKRFHVLILHIVSLRSLINSRDPVKISRDQLFAEKE